MLDLQRSPWRHALRRPPPAASEAVRRGAPAHACACPSAACRLDDELPDPSRSTFEIADGLDWVDEPDKWVARGPGNWGGGWGGGGGACLGGGGRAWGQGSVGSKRWRRRWEAAVEAAWAIEGVTGKGTGKTVWARYPHP